MRNLTSALLISTLVLSGCGMFGGSGRSQATPVASAEVNPLIPASGRSGLFSLRRSAALLPDAPLAAQVANLTVERVQGGSLIRATAVSDSVGAFRVSLAPLNNGRPIDGVLTYELRAAVAPAGTVPMPERARSHVAAVKLSDARLSGVREIRVQAARNVATSRR